MAEDGVPNGRVGQVLDLATRYGPWCVLAGVLIWFLLTRVSNLLTMARETQLEMKALLDQCCRK